MVAVTLWLLNRPEAAHAIGLVLGALALGGAITLMIGGVLADRHRRSRVIIAADLIRAISLVAMIVAGYLGPLWLLAALRAY